MAFNPSTDPQINLEFYNKILNLKDPVFLKEVEDIVDADLFRWYLFTEKIFRQQKEWQTDQEALYIYWDTMLAALEAVFQNYVRLKYSCG